MPNPQGTSFTEVLNSITVSTLKNYMKKPIDNMSKNNFLLDALRKAKSVKKKTGGSAIRVNLEYAENSSFSYYNGYDPLNLNPSNPFTFADFAWKQASVAVIFSGRERKANAGVDALFDLIKQKITNAITTFENQIEKSMFSDGSGFGGIEVEGLKLLIADDPSVGTVGGINRATAGNEFWRNRAIEIDAAGELNADPSKNTIQSIMNKMTNNLTLGGKIATNLIIQASDLYEMYDASLQAIQRITNAKQGESGYQYLSYKGIPVVNGGGIGGSCPAKKMYFLDTKGIQFNYLGTKMLDEITDTYQRMPNQDVFAKVWSFMGNMSITTPRTQGVAWYS